jgi:hypothetical protein
MDIQAITYTFVFNSWPKWLSMRQESPVAGTAVCIRLDIKILPQSPCKIGMIPKMSKEPHLHLDKFFSLQRSCFKALKHFAHRNKVIFA